MTRGGLKRIHILIIGIVVGLLVGVGAFFAVLKPDMDQITSVNDEKQGYDATILKRPQAEKAVVDANIQKATQTVALAKYENRYMRLGPNREFLSMKDPQKAMILLWKEQANTLGPLLTRYLKTSGVTLLTPLTIPGAPVDPNQINPNLYIVPLGQVQVLGTFAQINRFLNSLASSPRLIQVNNVQLAGESPALTATVDMSVLILPRDSTDFKAVPLATPDNSGGGGAPTPFGPGGPSSYGGPGGPAGGGANGGGANGAKSG